MEADLARYYGIALTDYYAGRVSLRRLRNLIRWLPAESATALLENDAQQKAEAAQQVADVENVLSTFQR